MVNRNISGDQSSVLNYSFSVVAVFFQILAGTALEWYDDVCVTINTIDSIDFL